MHALQQLAAFLPAFFPPYLKWSYLKALLAQPVPQTLAMAFGGSLIAITVGLLASLWIAAKGHSKRLRHRLREQRFQIRPLQIRREEGRQKGGQLLQRVHSDRDSLVNGGRR